MGSEMCIRDSIDHIVDVPRAERSHLPPEHRDRRARAAARRGPLPQDAARHRERSGGVAVVVEAGPLPGQPAQQPHLVIVITGQPVVPAPVAVVPDQAEPLVLARGILRERTAAGRRPGPSVPVLRGEVRSFGPRHVHDVINASVQPARLPPASYHLRIIVMCVEGYTSSLAAASLQDLGVAGATDLAGGFRAWQRAGLPVLAGPVVPGPVVPGPVVPGPRIPGSVVPGSAAPGSVLPG